MTEICMIADVEELDASVVCRPTIWILLRFVLEDSIGPNE
uniref:Uncharacterized protein n=1 Tax=Arundo donax TaxID=35708 RepID=A0A0A9AUS7_ARUDO